MGAEGLHRRESHKKEVESLNFNAYQKTSLYLAAKVVQLNIFSLGTITNLMSLLTEPTTGSVFIKSCLTTCEFYLPLVH